MSLTLSDIKYAAQLACIEVTDAEVEETLGPLNRAMALIERMQSVDVTGIEPMSHVQPISLRLRPDEVTETDQRDLFQSLSPAAVDGYYLVPKVIE